MFQFLGLLIFVSSRWSEYFSLCNSTKVFARNLPDMCFLKFFSINSGCKTAEKSNLRSLQHLDMSEKLFNLFLSPPLNVFFIKSLIPGRCTISEAVCRVKILLMKITSHFAVRENGDDWLVSVAKKKIPVTNAPKQQQQNQNNFQEEKKKNRRTFFRLLSCS